VTTEPATGPTRLPRRSWWAALRRTVRGYGNDNLTDWAAALTYYAVLSVFPGLLVLVSLLGLVGHAATDRLLGTVGTLAPGPARQILTGSVHGVSQAHGAAGVLAILGLAGALWSASGYVGAFMRAANAIYDVPEGRPIWKRLPVRVGITVVVGVLAAVAAIIVVFTGPLAEQAGRLVGAGGVAVTVWGIAKWPVLAVVVALMLAILYWASPNARQGWRWVSPGGLLALLIWVAASVGFGLYVAHFGSYNKTYGALGAVIIFLVWLWLSNLAILLGAEFDAELERSRAIAAGHPPHREPYVELRDTPKKPTSSDDLT
jgi:membrane protein